jgi:hypothetical protein
MCVGGLGGALGLLGRVAEGEDDRMFVEAVNGKNVLQLNVIIQMTGRLLKLKTKKIVLQLNVIIQMIGCCSLKLKMTKLCYSFM